MRSCAAAAVRWRDVLRFAAAAFRVVGCSVYLKVAALKTAALAFVLGFALMLRGAMGSFVYITFPWVSKVV